MRPTSALARAASRVRRGEEALPRLRADLNGFSAKAELIQSFKGWAARHRRGDAESGFPTGCLDILDREMEDRVPDEDEDVAACSFLTERQVKSLRGAGIESIGDLLRADQWELFQLSGIGRGTIRKIDRLAART